MSRFVPAILVALCAALGVALAFQRSALNDARREQEDLAGRLDRLEAKQKEAVGKKAIEELQEQVAEKHGFELVHHRMELYGVCPTCRAQMGSVHNTDEETAASP